MWDLGAVEVAVAPVEPIEAEPAPVEAKLPEQEPERAAEPSPEPAAELEPVGGTPLELKDAREALADDDLLCVAGSMYMAGIARETLLGAQA